MAKRSAPSPNETCDTLGKMEGLKPFGLILPRGKRLRSYSFSSDACPIRHSALRGPTRKPLLQNPVSLRMAPPRASVSQ